MVADTGLPQFVQIVAPDGGQAPGSEDVIEPVACLAPRPGVEDPAHVAALVAMKIAEDVAEIPLGQPAGERALGTVPARRPGQPVDRERLHLALGRLVARRVEVAAEDPVTGAGAGEPCDERLAGLDLHVARAPRRRDVSVVDLDLPGGRFAHRREDALGLRGADELELGDLPAAGCEVEEPARSPERARVEAMDETGVRKRPTPARQRARSHLLER